VKGERQNWIATGFGVALGVAVLVALATTSGRVEIPPAPAVLAAAVVVALGPFVVPARLRRLAAIVAAVGAGLAAAHVLAAPGVPRVHDLMHFWGIWAYGRAVHEGVLLPLWLPWLGAGLPLLQFYGPVNFLLALPGVVAGLSPVGAWKLEMLIGHLLSTLSMLAGARVAGLGWRGATVAAFACAFAPWRLSGFHYRGALGEANAFVAMPLIVGATLRMLRQSSLRVGLVLAAAVAVLVLTHLISVFTLVVVLVPALLAHRGVSSRNGTRALVAAALPFFVAAGITAFWWWPAVTEARFTSVKETTADNPYYRYAEQGVAASDMIERRLWDRLRFALPQTLAVERGIEDEQMPFYIGAVLLLMGLAAPLWARARESRAPAAGALVGVVLSTTWLAHALGWLPPLSVVRFPWRFFSPASVLLALALACGAQALWRSKGRAAWVHGALLPAILLACLAWDAAPYTGAADRIPPYSGTVHWYTDDPQWVHWHASMRAAPVELAPHQGVARTRKLELPPSEYDTEVDQFYPAYYEWFTPEVYRRYWTSRDPVVAAQAGVGYAFNNATPHPQRVTPRPYVSLEKDGRRLGAEPRELTRSPGRIRFRIDVPVGGATAVVLEQAFPGWRVRLDGDGFDVPGTTGGFLSTDLPSGSHRVEMVYGYTTLSRRAGILISLGSTVGLAVALIRRRIHSADKSASPRFLPVGVFGRPLEESGLVGR
jgi:riboflavin transporter FmnP